ncbi:MAG: zinc-binding dehydrogenase [Candidatus Lernaella stagnicola]|nr:zinc-binding dehydrogenase [Candidatus Lernaella stagnicola]
MQAIRLEGPGAPDSLRLVEQAIPEPGQKQVRIRVAAAGVNFADVLVRHGAYQPIPTFPLIPGLEIAGVVDAVGDSVDQAILGRRVVALVEQGGYAQYAVAHVAAVVDVPEDLPLETAAGLPVSGMTAYHLTHTVAAPEPGDWVVNYAAAGSVGSLINGLARARGAHVIALVGSDDKAARARELGAEQVLNYRDAENLPEAVAELTAGHGADVIYNSVFGSTVGDDFKMLAPRGQLVWFGVAGGMPNSKRLLAGMMRRFADAPRFSLYHLGASVKHDAERHRQGWQELFAHLRDGTARLPLHGVYALADAAVAHAALESRATMGKLVLKP